jgi:hypothetical protein
MIVMIVCRRRMNGPALASATVPPFEGSPTGDLCHRTGRPQSKRLGCDQLAEPR